VEWLTGARMAEMARAAALYLEREKQRIDRLNVFPVPDGDTGTNMALTVRAAVERLGPVDSGSDELDLAGVLSRLAQGALLGARGNSGTILSQYFQGLFDGAKSYAKVGPQELAHCLKIASETAYRAVETPAEGTILTVARAAAHAAAISAERGAGLADVWEAALESARLVLEQTPDMLPVLREAGVVDAGGEGLVVILEGALRVLRGEPLAFPAEPAPAGGGAANARAAAYPFAETGAHSLSDFHTRHAVTLSEIEYGYCTEFLIKGEGLSLEEIKNRLAPLGDSLLVVGGEAVVKVHLHTNHPGLALEIGCELGRIAAVSVGNMWEQNEEAASAADRAAAFGTRTNGAGTGGSLAGGVGVLAVVWGAGFAELLEGEGVTVLPQPAAGAKPSTGELLEAIESMPQGEIVLLPNNKDVALSAKQAARLAKKPVRVVPTASEAQAVAAAVCLQPGLSLDEVARRIEESAERLRVGMLTRAVRDAVLGGVQVREGMFIGMVSGSIVASGAELAPVLADLVQALGPEPGRLVTLYRGEEVSESEAGSHRGELAERWGDVEFEVYYGGQPVYHYVVSLE